MNSLIVHCADIHIRNTTRFDEYNQQIEKLINKVSTIKPRFVAIVGDLFHSQLVLSPESYSLSKKLVNGLSNHTKIIITSGNHDCNLNNLKRMDAITGFIDECDPEKVFYYKNSGIYEFEDDILLGVFSIQDKNYPICPKSDKIKIALYHGVISGSENHFGFKFTNAKDTVSIFDGWDIALLGDIHKMQTVGKKFQEKTVSKEKLQSYIDSGWEHVSENKVKKLYDFAKYSGSLIQQDFGESLEKGVLVWDLENFDNTFVPINNDYSFKKIKESEDISKIMFTKYVNVIYSGTKNHTFTEKVNIEKQIYNRAEQLGSKILKYNHEDVTQEDVVYLDGEIENIYDLPSQLSLLKEFLIQKDYKEDLVEKCLKLHQTVFNAIIPQNPKISSWSIENVKFSNLFLFGEDNEIDFSKLNGLIGIFGANAIGKSSIFSIIKYSIWGDSTNKAEAGKLIHHGENKASSEIILSIDNVRYKISRSIKRSDNEVLSSSVKIINLSNPDDTECQGSKTEIKEFIQSKFGTINDFHNTSFSSQFDIQSLIFTKPAARKQLFIDFFGLDIFNKFQNYVKNDYKEVESKIKLFSKETILEEFHNLEQRTNININRLKESVEKIENTNKEIAIIENDIEKLNLSIEKISFKEFDEEKAKNDITSLKLMFNNNQKIIDNFIPKEDFNDNAKKELEEKILLKKNEKTEIEQKISLKKNEKTEIEQKINANKIKLNNLNNENKNLNKDLQKAKSEVEIIDKQEWCRESDLCRKCMFLDNAFSYEKSIIDIEKNIEKINKELIDLVSLIEKINKELSDLVSLIEKDLIYSKNIDDELNILFNKIKEIDSYRELFNEFQICKERNENLLLKIDNINLEVSNYLENKEKIEKNKKVNEQILLQKNSLLNLNNLKKVIQNDSNNLDVMLKIDAEKINDINQKLIEIEQNEEKFLLYNSYFYAMERDGLPKKIMEKYISIVNSKVNLVINNVVDWKLKIEILDDELEIIIQENSGFLCPADKLGSGMQTTIAGLAIRVALLCISRKVKCKMLFIDEPLGSFDDEIVRKVENIFIYLKSIFSSVLLISHVNIHDFCDNIILLENDNNETKILKN